MTPNSRVQFAQWLKDTHPDLYEAAVSKAFPNGGLGFVNVDDVSNATKSGWAKFQETVLGLGTTYLALKNQRDMMKLNIERAKMGQPPIDAATAAPVVRTQVDIDPAIAEQITRSAGAGLSRTAVIVALAAGAYFLLKK